MAETETPFACDMTAIAPDERGAHLATSEKLFSSVMQVVEISNGYRFRLPADSQTLRQIADFIALEKLCCPFFAFTLEVEREGGSTWLSLTGRDGVKPFIVAEIGDHLQHILGPARFH